MSLCLYTTGPEMLICKNAAIHVRQVIKIPGNTSTGSFGDGLARNSTQHVPSSSGTFRVDASKQLLYVRSYMNQP
jgi:hypothetical protein